MILIGDDRVKAIPVKECGEPFIDLAPAFPDLKFDLTRHMVQKKSESISFGRRKTGEMLIQAQKNLPQELRLLVREVYRPLWIQREYFEGYSKHLAEKYPQWTPEQVYNECSKLNAPVDVAPHSTGGAVDLTLIDQQGNVLDMGTEFNAEPEATADATFTDAQNIPEHAKQNRKILKTAMLTAGFVNYPTEWWHWSYGDKYWALQTKAEAAIFSSRENF